MARARVPDSERPGAGFAEGANNESIAHRELIGKDNERERESETVGERERDFLASGPFRSCPENCREGAG